MSLVSIITCTHLPVFRQNILDNYERQLYPHKELIIILNNNALSLEDWTQFTSAYKNTRVFRQDEKDSIGSCLNFAVSKSNGDYIANFDHDDFYGPNYLNGYMAVVNKVDAGLFGKRTHFVYLEKGNLLALRHPGMENRFVDFVDGPTIFCRKSIFEKVQFEDKDEADWPLSFACLDKGIRVYSIDKYNFVYMRRSQKQYHAWKIGDKEFLSRYCKIIGKGLDYNMIVKRRP